MTDLDREQRQGESLVTTIKRLVEEAAPEGVTMRDLQAKPQLETTPPTSISATLSQLRGDRENTGIIRIAPGEYAYRPDNLESDTGDVTAVTNRVSGQKGKVVSILRNEGKPITTEAISNKLVEQFEMTLTRKQISSSLVALVRDDPHVERLSPGVYYYNPNPKDSPAINPELANAIPDSALEEGTGLKIVARTQEGARIAVDENGVAWQISVKVESRLL